MTPRKILWIALRTAAGLCAVFVTLRGLRGAYGMEFRTDTLVSLLYCALPAASFLVFLFPKAPKSKIALHIFIAIGYWGSFSFLNWRTCAELGYCSTVASTILMTLSTKPVMAAFAIIVFSIAAYRLHPNRHSANQL